MVPIFKVVPMDVLRLLGGKHPNTLPAELVGKEYKILDENLEFVDDFLGVRLLLFVSGDDSLIIGPINATKSFEGFNDDIVAVLLYGYDWKKRRFKYEGRPLILPYDANWEQRILC